MTGRTTGAWHSRVWCGWGAMWLISVVGLLQWGDLWIRAGLADASRGAAGSSREAAVDETERSRDGRWRVFQPGVWIDWQGRRVAVEGEVVLRAGALEFFACFPGKEHESIVLMRGEAAAVYMALGLVGFAPGDGGGNDGDAPVVASSGDLVSVSVTWEADGELHEAAAMDWVQELEYARAARRRPWVFGGSIRLGDGSLAADRTGAGVALVDIPEALLVLPSSYSRQDSALWCGARTRAIPPLRTRVRVVFGAAAYCEPELRVDFRGAAYVNDRYCTARELVAALRLARSGDGEGAIPIRFEGTLGSDRRELLSQLRSAGIRAVSRDD